MRNKSILVVVISILASTANAEILYYNLIDLGGNDSVAYSINNNGQVVGEAKTGSRPMETAILFDTTGGGNNIELGSTLSGNRSNAYSINNNGQAVGIVGFQAVLFDTTGNNDDIILGTLGDTGDFDYGHASAINDNRQIVGHSKYGGYNLAATFFDYTGNGNNIYLGGRSNSDWYAINNYGQVVGGDYTTTPYNHTQAMLYDITGSGNNILLGTLGGTYSLAYAINDSGQIVGRARYAGTDGSLNGPSHATVFAPSGNGNNVDLDPFGGTSSSTARSINNNGQIVGDAGGYATLFDITGAGNNINLNDLIAPSLGWNLKMAWGINDNGWIVGYGTNPYGDKSAYLLTPVPEPSTPPVADADGPYSIYVGDSLTLDASGSTDADDDIVRYMWDLDDDGVFETDAGGQAIFAVDYAYLESLELLINYTYTIHLKVIDSEGQSDIAGSTLIIVPKPAVKVAVDIKPGSCPNPVNVKSSGVLPIAILGTADYDVTTIDPTSIRLAGVEPLRSGYEDVAAPVSDSNDCNCVEAGPDGLLDLTLKFETQGIVKAIGDVNDGDVLTLELTGVLLDPIPFETPIEGADCILIKGWHKAPNKADINKDGVVDMTDFAIISENWLKSSIVDN